MTRRLTDAQLGRLVRKQAKLRDDLKQLRDDLAKAGERMANCGQKAQHHARVDSALFLYKDFGEVRSFTEMKRSIEKIIAMEHEVKRLSEQIDPSAKETDTYDENPYPP